MKRIGILIVALTLVASGSAFACDTVKHVKVIEAFHELTPIVSDCLVAITVPEAVVSVELLSEAIECIGEFIEAEDLLFETANFFVVGEVPMLEEASVEVTDGCGRGASVLMTVMKALAKAALKGVAGIIHAVV